ncbi:MAG: triose-phosphate isomerase [Candidatus Eremiobacteraeota bacterium]|nr:triose-phosphate isomerase [Candidatus Eremiobacteraeota bacterium]
MNRRAPLFVGNWKMNKNASQTRSFIESFLPLAEKIPPRVGIAIAPPFTALAAAAAALAASGRVALAAQTMSEYGEGAYTGEIAASMLEEWNVAYVILGHSERRLYQHESDAVIGAKVRAASEAGMTPILAVGESLTVREEGNAVAHVLAQIEGALGDLSEDRAARLVIAYEPIWAIGTGKNCDRDQAQEIAHAIRCSRSAFADIPILYGGSMKPENAAAYLQMPDIDGGLVGGASLDAASFAALIAGALAA